MSRQIVQAVITMDDEVLDMEIIRSLRQQAPTNDDITALKEFDGDHSKLGKVFAGCCNTLVLLMFRLRVVIVICRSYSGMLIRTSGAVGYSWLGLAGLGRAVLGAPPPPVIVVAVVAAVVIVFNYSRYVLHCFLCRFCLCYVFLVF